MPNISNLSQYIDGAEQVSFQRASSSQLLGTSRSSGTKNRQRDTVYDFSVSLDERAMLEERSIFIDLVRQEYNKQLESGQLDSRSFIPHNLLRSLDMAEKNKPLDDWDASSQAKGSMLVKKGEQALHSYRVQQGLFRRNQGDKDFHIIRTRVLQALSFIQAHQSAQDMFKKEFASVNKNSLSLAEKAVIDESRIQVSKAYGAINAFDIEDVKAVKSQYVCQESPRLYIFMI